MAPGSRAVNGCAGGRRGAHRAAGRVPQPAVKVRLMAAVGWAQGNAGKDVNRYIVGADRPRE